MFIYLWNLLIVLLCSADCLYTRADICWPSVSVHVGCRFWQPTYDGHQGGPTADI